MSGSLTTTVHELFEQRACASPCAVALRFEEKAFTYGWLNERANRLAHRLKHKGVTRGTFVGLCMDRCPEVVVGLLAILKAGGVYIPLDPSYPVERLAFMLSDTAAPYVLAHGPTAAALSVLDEQSEILCVDANELEAAKEPDHNPEPVTSGVDLAYVMYTSGSTGRPKGVLVRHRGVIRLVRNTNYCRFDPGEVFLQMAPLAFDASTFEIWGPLLNGACLALCPPGVLTLDDICDVLDRHGVTTLWLTSGLFHLMVDQRPSGLGRLRQLLAGGDVLSPSHVKKALAAMGENGVLINGYGPTESTTFACCFTMARGYQVEGNVPIGRPISNTTVHVLDEGLKPVPVGAPGELYIGGDGLAAGYLNLPELTRERFVPNTLGENPEGRLYRTGDRGRYRPDGNLEFLGRIDDQVKIAGYRIELGEVETVLRRHPGVLEAAVAAPMLPSGGRHLVAYIVTRTWGDELANEMKRHLAEKLPSYMVPAHIVRLDQMPLTPNGKIDRTALPARHPASPIGNRAGNVASSLEDDLRAVWARVLQRDVGLDENFFDLGGSSLQLLEVHAEMTKALGRRIQVTELFEYATVRSCAKRLADNGDRPSVLAAAHQRATRQREALARNKRVKVPGHE